MRKQLGTMLVLGAALAVGACQDKLVDSSNLGNIIIYTSTSGVIDSNGYKFTLDTVTHKPQITVQANDTSAFYNLKDSTYHIRVSDIKAGCSLAGGPDRDVVVPAATVVEQHFNFTCPAAP